MSRFRKLGKGLEELSPLFLSSGKEKSLLREAGEREGKQIPPEPGPELTTKYVCLVGEKPDFQHAFSVFLLSLALAESGIRIAIVDMDEELPCMELLKRDQTGSALSKPSDSLTREGPAGVQFIGFSESRRARFSASRVNDGILGVLSNVEETHDLILLSIAQETLLRMDRALPGLLREFIVFVSQDNILMLNAYKIIKALFSLNPEVNVGALVRVRDTVGEADSVYDRIAGAVRKFLARELHNYGVLQRIEPNQHTLSAGDSLREHDLSEHISHCSRMLMFRLTREKSSPSPGLLFEISDRRERLSDRGL